ncbi:Sulfurtransferase [Polaromonas vacuolata]|uniref:Sulfurtransferase n=1 Tax=Polaromonas vacuolata TaxID=37448 RepID=A0A6H2H6I3_9BURK|nr:rhodanese-like domain-containing protein [Polaromonas vacuolata]QJC55468.1 Sulfurtransferase [Polaromonas vacuolata]
MTLQLNPANFLAWRDVALSADAKSTAEKIQPIVLDVRENWELQIASVQPDGFTLLHIPMGQISARLSELQDALDGDQPIACLCHHGIRSQRVASFLAQNGFSAVVNLQGGIQAWSNQLDTSVPHY